MTDTIQKAASNLPLHHPARVALLDAYRQIVDLRDALRVRMAETYCDECDASMITDEHAETCRHYATEEQLIEKGKV